MARIHWTKEFSVGEHSLDMEHRELLRMINHLLDHHAQETSSAIISKLLAQMTEYTARHFQHEEALLEQCGYPALKEHQQKHRIYLENDVYFCQVALVNAGDLSDLLEDYLMKWWRGHLFEEDMKYKPYMENFAYAFSEKN